MANGTDKAVAEVIERLGGLAEKLGPSASDAVLGAARLSAITQIALGLGLFALGAIFWWCCGNLQDKAKTDKKNEDMNMTGAAICFFLALGGVGSSLFFLLNIPAWIGMFHPEIYLAYRAIF